MTATQDERLSNRLINSNIVFCSKAEAFLYAVLHPRDPDEQKKNRDVPASVSDRYHKC